MPTKQHHPIHIRTFEKRRRRRRKNNLSSQKSNWTSNGNLIKLFYIIAASNVQMDKQQFVFFFISFVFHLFHTSHGYWLFVLTAEKASACEYFCVSSGNSLSNIIARQTIHIWRTAALHDKMDFYFVFLNCVRFTVAVLRFGVPDACAWHLCRFHRLNITSELGVNLCVCRELFFSESLQSFVNSVRWWMNFWGIFFFIQKKSEREGGKQEKNQRYKKERKKIIWKTQWFWMQ